MPERASRTQGQRALESPEPWREQRRQWRRERKYGKAGDEQEDDERAVEPVGPSRTRLDRRCTDQARGAKAKRRRCRSAAEGGERPDQQRNQQQRAPSVEAD